ncbi:cytochrome b5 domain-containing protein [Candidatus Kaiserbacteria bacterium]|nr:cytochrome b5 domain-containing protein [Candidatus Kaiserbacteria bacterium]
MKYLLAVVIILAAGGVFFWQYQKADVPLQESNQQQNAAGNPFGDGARTVGNLDDDENETEDEDEDGMTGTNAGGGTGSTGGGGTPGAIVTRATLSTHNKVADCWIAYKGVVYDITNWLPRHPGSAGAIAPYCGKAEEFSAAFNKQHGTSKETRLKQEGTVEGTLSN